MADTKAEREDPGAGEAILALGELGPTSKDSEKRNITTEEAEKAGAVQLPVIENARYDRAQDHLAFEASRREEALAQGVQVTTQEAMRQIARDEEARAQGVASIDDTTQKQLFRGSRKEEVTSEYIEQAMHGPVEPLTVGEGGIDQVALDESAQRKLSADELERHQARSPEEGRSKRKSAA